MSKIIEFGCADQRLMDIVNTYVMTKDKIHTEVSSEVEKYLKEIFGIESADSKYELSIEPVGIFTVNHLNYLGIHHDVFLLNKENNVWDSLFTAMYFYDNGSVQIQFDACNREDPNDPNLSKVITDASEVRGIIENWVKNIFPNNNPDSEKDFVAYKLKMIDESFE